MLIDHVFPHLVKAKAPLKELLLKAAVERGISPEHAHALIASIPAPLINAGAFLDKSTNLWRYEFGEPFEIGDQQVFGTHMWLPVNELFTAVATANALLPDEKRAAYFAVLNNQAKHPVSLAEMMPTARFDPSTNVAFEVAGHGVGNTTVDWVVHTPNRLVLLDAKSRTIDFIKQVENANSDGEMPEPKHDHALLFQSLEKKFLPADPDTKLQGAWITTHIKQNVFELDKAFGSIDPSKLHFALFGDWMPDVGLLVRREADRQFILDLFKVKQSDRFIYVPQ